MMLYDIKLVWDPIKSEDLDRYEIYRAPNLPIIGIVNRLPAGYLDTFVIEGSYGSWFDNEGELTVSGSTGNNAPIPSTPPYTKDPYTIVQVVDTGTTTEISVVVTEHLNAIADGYIGTFLLEQLAGKTSSTSFLDKELPRGFYYYVIYAVDKDENYSDPSNIIIKSAPESFSAPAQPTGLTIRRTDDLLDMELYWNANTEEDLKGYVIYRSFDGLTYDIIAVQGSTSNNYKDNKIPPQMDTDSNTTPVIYAVSAIDKSFNESIPAGPTWPLEVPILTGLRAIIDYLSLNVYWNFNKPEDGITAYDIYYKEVGVVPWTLAGTVDYPQLNFRIIGPLTKNKTYEVGVVVNPFTGGIPYLQPLPIPVTIPDYEVDTTKPTSPEFLEADLDPESNRMFISWKRAKVDDDFLHYALWWGRLFDIIAVDQTAKTFTIQGYQMDFFSAGEYLQVTGSFGNDWIYTIKTVTPGGPPASTIIEVNETINSPLADGMLFQLILDGITTQNNYTFRNMRNYFAREDAPINRALILAVTAYDRAGNQSNLIPTSYLWVYWISQDMAGPTWLDYIRTINSGLFNEHDGTIMPVTPFAQFYLQWNDIGRAGKYFRRYIVFETVTVDPTIAWGDPPTLGVPEFDFDDNNQIRGYSNDNSFTIYNHDLVRGFRTTDSERLIFAVGQVSKYFEVQGNQQGHFRIGNPLVVYDTTSGNAKTYTITSVTLVGLNTRVGVSEAIVSPTVAGKMYDSGLNKSKWYTVLSEDWFGEIWPASPYPWREVK